MMMTVRQMDAARRMLAAVTATLEERADELSALDAALGDGDHGVSLIVGFRNVTAALQDWDAPNAGAVVERVGAVLLGSVGGAMGPLYGTAFMQAGKAAVGRTTLDGPIVATMLEAAREGVATRGKARPGDKTMLDALAPAAAAGRAAAAGGADAVGVLRAASAAAERGAAATREMIARKGRASRLGERSRGHQDAGATSTALLLGATFAAFVALHADSLDQPARTDGRRTGGGREGAMEQEQGSKPKTLDPNDIPGRPHPSGILDPYDPTFMENRFKGYSELRDTCPLMHVDRYGGFWLLSRHDDVKQVATDWRTYTSTVVGVTAIPIISHRTEAQLPIELDPPLHGRYRRLMNPAFGDARMAELKPKIVAIAHRLIDAITERGRADLVEDFTIPFSVGTLFEFAGLPHEDTGLWVEWIRRMFNPDDPADSALAGTEQLAYLDALVAARAKEPSDDLISVLLASRVEGHHLTREEVRSFAQLMFTAGFETTSDGMSVTLHYLAQHPDDRRRLIADRGLIPTAVEEFLRYATPIQIFGRNTTKDVEFYGETIPQGDIVAVSYASANYDPAAFPEPDRCVLDRTQNSHFAFGAGPHLCAGAPVARLEMTVLLEEVIPRIPEYRVAPGAEVVWKHRGDRQGLASLPVVVGE